LIGLDAYLDVVVDDALDADQHFHGIGFRTGEVAD
jgi:hypothetical protein